MTTDEPALALEHLVCAFGGRAVLNIESLRIGRAERVALVGHNGAGKSTLLKAVSGFVHPIHGEISVLGHRLWPAPSLPLRMLRQDIGQVLQGLHLVPQLSAMDNVLIGCLGRVTGWRSWIRWFPADEVRRAKEALFDVGMLARADTRADRLSGGERQKVAIARMLLQRPRLILADEPTAALDPAAGADVCRLLAGAAANACLVTVVHNPSLLPVLADRVIGLRQGRIAFNLPVAEVSDSVLMELYRPVSQDAVMPWQGGEEALAALLRTDAGTTPHRGIGP